MPIDRNEIECMRCTHPMAEDVRFWLGACSDLDLEQQSSPMGRPLSCCKIRIVGEVPKDMVEAPAR